MNKLNINRITFYNILSNVILQGMAFLTIPFFSRMLGPENYGILSIYSTWESITVIILGLQTESTLSVARTQYGEKLWFQYQSSVLCLSALSYLFFSFIGLFLIDYISDLLSMSPLMCIVMIIHSFGHFCVSFACTKFTYEFRADKNFTLSITNAFFSMTLSIFLVSVIPTLYNYWGRILGIACCHILLGIIMAFLILKQGKILFHLEYWKFALTLSVPMIFYRLSDILLNQCDRIMLQRLADNSVVGVYSLAVTFGNVLYIIQNAFNNSWSPFYYEYAKLGDIKKITAHAKKYLEVFTIISIGFVLLSPEVFRIFANKEYWNGINLISILSCGLYMNFLCGFPIRFLLYKKKTESIAIGTILAAITNLILNIFMIQMMGMIGAAFATAISHCLEFIFQHICVKYMAESAEYPFSLKFFAPYVFFLSLTIIICFLSENSFKIIRWLLGITLGLYELSKIYKRKSIF